MTCARNLLIALIISLVSAASPLISYYLHPKVAFVHLQIDDPYYLGTLRDLGNHQASEGFFLEHKQALPTSELLTQRVTSPLEYVTASFFQKLGFSASGSGLFLDFLSIFFSCLIFLYFYAHFTSNRRAIVVATITTLFFPDLFQLRIFGQQVFFGGLVSPQFLPEDPPILRSIDTQLSYLAYGVTLVVLMRLVESAERIRRNLPFLAILIALQFYVYFFSWATSLVLSALFLLFSLPGLSGEQRRAALSLKTLGLSAILFLICMLPGFWLLRQAPDAGISTVSQIRDFYAFPLETAVLCLFFSIYLLFGRIPAANKKVMLLAISLLIAEFPLLNLQPLLGVGLAPYHFSVFYLRPIFGGLCILLVENFVSRFPFLVLRWSIAGIVISLFLLVSVRGLKESLTTNPALFEFEELVDHLEAKATPNAVIATMYHWKPFQEKISPEFAIRVFPQLVYLLTKHPVLGSDWAISSKLKDEEVLHRELLTGYLFSGKMQLLWPCLTEMPELPGDMFTCTWTYFLIRRWQHCTQHRTDIENYSACQGLKDFKVDYLLYDADLPQLKLPQSLEPYTEQELVTKHKGFILYRFLQEKFLRENCSS